MGRIDEDGELMVSAEDMRTIMLSQTGGKPTEPKLTLEIIEYVLDAAREFPMPEEITERTFEAGFDCAIGNVEMLLSIVWARGLPPADTDKPSTIDRSVNEPESVEPDL